MRSEDKIERIMAELKAIFPYREIIVKPPKGKSKSFALSFSKYLILRNDIIQIMSFCKRHDLTFAFTPSYSGNSINVIIERL
jgi:hypothetical protein